MVLENMIASGQLKEEDREDIMEILLAKHRHQHQKKRDERGMSIVRSMQEIGRRASTKNLDPKGTLSSPKLFVLSIRTPVNLNTQTWNFSSARLRPRHIL